MKKLLHVFVGVLLLFSISFNVYADNPLDIIDEVLPSIPDVGDVIDIVDEVVDIVGEIVEAMPTNHNKIAKKIDQNNPAYLVLKEFGCDLTADITNGYDFGILVMQFIFASSIILCAVKMLMRLSLNLTRGGL